MIFYVLQGTTCKSPALLTEEPTKAKLIVQITLLQV